MKICKDNRIVMMTNKSDKCFSDIYDKMIFEQAF